jgi:C-terminal processing protease CtpA/Prc
MNRSGNVTAYGKPIMVLTDEMSFSAADEFPAMLQDNGAAVIFGNRTAGAGGPVIEYGAGAYSEGTVSVTIGLMVRKAPIVTPDFPTTSYIENVGVRPDVEYDFMTRDNLLRNGKTFVEDFTGAMVSYILTGKP